MRQGLPPNYERIAFRRKLVAGYLLVMGAIAAIVFFASPQLFRGSDDFDPRPFPAEAPRVTNQEQSEFASAYQAVQRVVLEEAGPQYSRNAQWLETRHEGHWGWYSFEGRVQLEDWQGNERIFEYNLVVALDLDGTWKASEIVVE